MKRFILALFVLFFNVVGLHSGNSAKFFVQNALNQVIQAQEALKQENGLHGVRRSRAFFLQARNFLREAKTAHEGSDQGAAELRGQSPISVPRAQQQPIEVVGGTFDPRAALVAALSDALARPSVALLHSSVGARKEQQSVIHDRADHQQRHHPAEQEGFMPLQSSEKGQAGAQNQRKLSATGEVQAPSSPLVSGHEGQQFGCEYCEFRAGAARWVKRHQLEQHQGQDVKIVDYGSETESDYEVSQQQEAPVLTISQRKRATSDEEQGGQKPARKRQRVDEATRSKQKKNSFECSHCRRAGSAQYVFSNRFSAARHHKRKHKGLPLSIHSFKEGEGNDDKAQKQQEPSLV